MAVDVVLSVNGSWRSRHKYLCKPSCADICITWEFPHEHHRSAVVRNPSFKSQKRFHKLKFSFSVRISVGKTYGNSASAFHAQCLRLAGLSSCLADSNWMKA